MKSEEYEYECAHLRMDGNMLWCGLKDKYIGTEYGYCDDVCTLRANGTTPITVDPDFHAAIPPLSQEERAQLEQNIIESGGARDPLSVWRDNGHMILLDGHHRYEICSRLNLPFQVSPLEFKSKDDALDWIDRNQLGRRNLGPDQMSMLRGRRYNRTKNSHGGERGNQYTVASGQNVHLAKPAEKLAREHGVDERTIRRDGAFAASVDKLKAVDADIERKIVAGGVDAPPKSAVVQAAKLLQSDPVLASAVLAGEKNITAVSRQKKEEVRETRRAENAQKVAGAVDPLAVGAKFATIVIDPPWDWGDEGDVDQLGRARPTYSTMPFDKLMDLPVDKLADVDCHLYLWITNRSLPKGFDLISKWGFRFVTCLTWCKPSFGMGNYFRGSTEHILFAVKGSQQLKRKDVGTWFQAQRGPDGHSSKPDSAFKLIESCSPGPYLEMFARKNRDGWICWGGEI